jgi:hypothetical protein
VLPALPLAHDAHAPELVGPLGPFGVDSLGKLFQKPTVVLGVRRSPGRDAVMSEITAEDTVAHQSSDIQRSRRLQRNPSPKGMEIGQRL